MVPTSKKCLGRGKKNEKEEKEEKTKNARIATKIGAKIKFGTANSKIMVPSSENLQKKVKKKEKKKKGKVLGSQRKLVSRLNSVRRILGSQRKLAHISNSVRRIQKSWFRVLKIVWGGVRRMKKKKKRRKNEKCSDRNENWYQDQFRYGEFKNCGPGS